MPLTQYTLVIMKDGIQDRSLPVSWSNNLNDLSSVNETQRLDYYIAHQNVANQYNENHSNDQWCFICREDIQKLINFAQTNNMYIGVRDTGALSLNRITQGFACKPHEILEKSFKGKSVVKEYTKFQMLQTFVNVQGNAPLNKLVFRFIPRVKQRDSFLPFYEYENIQFLSEDQEDPEIFEISFELLKFDKTLSSEQISENPFEVQTLPRDQVLVIEAAKMTSWSDLMKLVESRFTAVLNPNKSNVVALFEGYVGAWATLVVEATNVDPSNIKPGSIPSTKGQAYSQPQPPMPFTVDGKQTSTVTINVPMAVLRVNGTRLPQDNTAPKYGDEVDISAISSQGSTPKDGYTGDYDLHEVFITNTEGKATEPSVFPPSSHTSAAPTALSDVHSIEEELKKLLLDKRNIVIGDWNNPSTEGRDALSCRVQHGPQNMYRQFIDAENRENLNSLGDTLLDVLNNDDDISKAFREPSGALKPEVIERFEEYVEALAQPDSDGVVLFAPTFPTNSKPTIFLLQGTASVQRAYRQIGVTSANKPWVGPLPPYKWCKMDIVNLSNPPLLTKANVQIYQNSPSGQTKQLLKPLDNSGNRSWDPWPIQTNECTLSLTVFSNRDDIQGVWQISVGDSKTGEFRVLGSKGFQIQYKPLGRLRSSSQATVQVALSVNGDLIEFSAL